MERAEFNTFDSDRRFLEAMRALETKATQAEESPGPDILLEGPSGKGVVSQKRGKATSQLIFNETLAPGFMHFLAGELPNFYRRYLAQASPASSSKKTAR